MRYLNDFINEGVWSASAGSLYFIIGYSRDSKWWKYAWGKVTVTLDLSVVITLIPAVFHLAFGIAPRNMAFWAWWTAVSLNFIAVNAVWRRFVVRRIHREAIETPLPDSVAEDRQDTEALP